MNTASILKPKTLTKLYDINFFAGSISSDRLTLYFITFCFNSTSTASSHRLATPRLISVWQPFLQSCRHLNMLLGQEFCKAQSIGYSLLWLLRAVDSPKTLKQPPTHISIFSRQSYRFSNSISTIFIRDFAGIWERQVTWEVGSLAKLLRRADRIPKNSNQLSV